MKKLIFTALSIMTVMFCAPVIAQEPTTSTETIQNDDHGRKPVKYSELPQAVKDALNTNYKGWEVDETAYCVRREDNTVKHYEVSLKNISTGESKMVKFDENGRVVA